MLTNSTYGRKSALETLPRVVITKKGLALATSLKKDMYSHYH
jgi:hypothetical protein